MEIKTKKKVKAIVSLLLSLNILAAPLSPIFAMGGGKTALKCDSEALNNTETNEETENFSSEDSLVQNNFSSGMAPTESDFLQMDLDAEVPAEDNFFQTVRPESDFLETTSPQNTPEQGLEDPASTPATQNDEPESGLTLTEWNYTEENGGIVLDSLKDNNAKNVVVPGEFAEAPGKQVYIKGKTSAVIETLYPSAMKTLKFISKNGSKVKFNGPSGKDAFSLTNLENFDGTGLDTSNVENMERMFALCEYLKKIDGVSEWDTSNVTNMEYMFAGCRLLSNIQELELWDTSNVTNMRQVFYDCKSLTDISSLKDWNTSNVTDMSEMFEACPLTDISSLKDWDTSNVTNMDHMFYDCKSLTDISSLKDWDISNVTNMDNMFYGCDLTDISSLKDWDTSNITNMNNMFASYSALTDISPLKDWDTENVENMKEMFDGCAALTDISPLKNWSTPKLTDTSRMFAGCDKLKFADLSNWDLSSNGRNVNMNEMFHTSGSTPLLVIAKDEKFSEYNYAGDNRTPVGPTFDANGGKFPESTDGEEETGISTQAEGEPASGESEIKQGKTTNWLANNTTAVDEFINTAIEQPTRDDGLVFCGWEVQDPTENPNAYDRMTETYKARWGQIDINANNKEIEQGQAFDPLDGVTATDGNGDPIPAEQITVISNDVDVNKLGDYSVTYEAADSYGNTAQKTITVTVTEKPQVIEPDKNDSGDSKEEEYNWLKTGNTEEEYNWLKTGNSQQIDKFAWIMLLSLGTILKFRRKKDQENFKK